MEPRIQFAETADGVNIAVATMGSGPPLIFIPGWISHLELDFATPAIRDFFERLAEKRFLVRYDKRGTGLSDRNVSDYSPQANLRDLESILHSLGLQRFALMGISQGGPIAIAYAVEHPDAVSHLILYGCYHDGTTAYFRELIDGFVNLIQADWGGYGATAILEMFLPGAPPDIREGFAEYERQAATAEGAIATLTSFFEFRVTHLLRQVSVPTLVVHRRGDRTCPFQQGRQMAARIRGARFVPLEGDIHAPYFGDTEPLLRAIDEFLGEGEEAAAGPAPSGLVTILFTDMEGSTTLTQRVGDAKAHDVLRTHNRIVRDALKAHGGSEVKTMGDGFMASFASASRALECAIVIQRALAQHNESNPDMPIRVRIGLNAGEPVAEEEDLFGTAVQLAARVCGRAEPGQILASNVVRELAAGKGFLLSDQGDVVLRGFEDPVRLYEVRWQ
jgi:class 3 adenylate cyclase